MNNRIRRIFARVCRAQRPISEAEVRQRQQILANAMLCMI